MIRFVSAFRRRHDRRDESGSAMLMSVLFTVFAGGIMLVLLTVLLSQAQAAGLTQKNTRTGYAAQSGIQASLSVIRSNTKTVGTGSTTETYGDPTKLPETLSGTVDGTADGDLKYEVDLTYYTTDPTGRTDAWLSQNALAWPLSADVRQQPRFVRIESEGIDSAVAGLGGDVGDRTIVALYAFTTTNVNIPGGVIRTANLDKCLKAESATVGSRIKVVPAADCSDESLNSWVYATDYQLKLASTLTSAAPLCITGQQWVATPTGTNNSTANATLQPCAATNDAAFGNQLWAWDTPDSWSGQRRDNTPVPTPNGMSATSNRWLAVGGDWLVEQNRGTRSFAPDARVGAGAASIDTTQIVNFAEFGRCMDVALNRTTTQFMIVYPCKQDPSGTGVAVNWNHKWHYAEPAGGAASSAPQPLWIEDGKNGNRKMCLTTRPASSGNTDTYFSACPTPDNPASLTAAQQFIRNTNTGTEVSSYTFQLASDPSQCLAAVVEPGYDWSHLRLVPCNGSAAQKWNAPPQRSGSVLGGYKEIG